MRTFRLWFLIEALALAYLALTAGRLPPVMASHFVTGGAANGFMLRVAYLRLMAGLLLGLPLLLLYVHRTLADAPGLRLPRRDYWLAPERRAATRAELTRRALQFCSLLVLFLTFVHGRVVAANQLQPPHLDERAMLGGLWVFLAAAGLWALAFMLHFARPPAPG